MIFGIGAATLSTSSGVAHAASTTQSIMIPGYSYPTTWTANAYWDSIVAAGSAKVPFVIMNPSSGPGTQVNSDYQEQIRRNTAAGIKYIGYVETGYQSRPIADVIRDIDARYGMYGATSGIMFDQIQDRT